MGIVVYLVQYNQPQHIQEVRTGAGTRIPVLRVHRYARAFDPSIALLTRANQPPRAGPSISGMYAGVEPKNVDDLGKNPVEPGEPLLRQGAKEAANRAEGGR